MAGKYQSYPEYKSSERSWLGDIPIEWESTRINSICTFEKGYGLSKNDLDDEGKYPCILYGELYTAYKDFNVIEQVKSRTNSKIGYESKGDEILIPASTTTTGIDLANANHLPYKGVLLGGDIIILKPRKNYNKKYVSYFITNVNKRQFIQYSKGVTIYHIYASSIKNMPIFLPSIKEQRNIANFLDHETAKIDTLIKKQQQLIKLLKEKRQAVISHAVTKGLNSNVPMRDSGIEWLGEVPEHWEVSQLKFNTLEMQTGPFGSQLHAEDYVIDGIPLINPAHIIDGKIVPDTKVTVDKETHERLSRHKLSNGEIIFARRGELGRCAIVSKDQEGWLCGTGSLKAKLNNRLAPEYAYLLITSEGVVSELTLESKGSTMDNLNTETLGRVRMPVPPESEQQKILVYVDNISGKYKALISNTETAIKLMQERRTALISAAVTGKIDVRNWQTPNNSNVQEVATL